MKLRFYFLITLIVSTAEFYSCNNHPRNPEEVLSQISIIDSIKQIENDSLFTSTYEIWFRMPVDHFNANSPVFPLRAIYSHKDFNSPVVAVLDGYTLYTTKSHELSQLLGANQITIEHRFYNQSRPKDSIPWNYLTVRQAAYDQHQIIQEFKKFYKGKWISTGISKSGQTTIFHRRFYPGDVDVSVPYVAPLNFSSEDSRAYSFLHNVGTPECRTKVFEFQKALFEKKEKIYPLFVNYLKDKPWVYPMGLDRAYDLSVLEYQFAFWQWGIPCESIPSKEASPEKLFDHWSTVNPFSFFDSEDMDTQTFLYQAMTEIGMYGYELAPFKKYLRDTANITFKFSMPQGHHAAFNPEVMQDINRWVKDSGNFILYIYGQNDGWSSTAVEPGNKTNAVKMVNPGGNHTTRIKSFPPEMQDSIYSVLEKWLQVDLSKNKSMKSAGTGKPYRFPIL